MLDVRVHHGAQRLVLQVRQLREANVGDRVQVGGQRPHVVLPGEQPVEDALAAVNRKLIAAADQSLYQAKQRGRNRIAFVQSGTEDEFAASSGAPSGPVAQGAVQEIALDSSY